MPTPVLQDITYNMLEFADIKNPTDFFKTGDPKEMIPLRTLYNNTRLLWGLGADQILLSVAQGQVVYKLTLFMKNKRNIFGCLVYIPGQRRLDLYTSESPLIPLIQWKKQKVVNKTYPLILELAGIEKMFSRLVSVL